MISEPFFILGCQRSGTTLVRLILESHSKITCFDEPDCYNLLSHYKDTTPNLNKIIGFKTPIITEQMNQPFFSDSNLDFIIENKFQDAPKIFLIRDVRDTISSMKTLQQDKTTWYNIWPKKSIEFWKFTIPDFKTKYSEDLKKISNSKNKLLANASFFWKYKTESIFEYEKNKSTVCRIHYEDLVTNKKNSIKQLIKFLGVNWEDDLLHHDRKKHNFTDNQGITVGNTDTKLPIFNKSVGRYREDLSSQEIEEIRDISGNLMEKLGYEI